MKTEQEQFNAEAIAFTVGFTIGAFGMFIVTI